MAITKTFTMTFAAAKTAASLSTKGYGVTAEILAAYEFQAPVTFAFDANKLYCGIPIDAIELQIPIVKKVVQDTRILQSSTRISSNSINKHFINEDALKNGWLPPYPANISLRKIVFDKESKFCRVHVDPNRPNGGFLVREKDIAPFINDPEAIRLYLGLPNKPIYITDVYISKNDRLIVGRIGPQPTFGLMEKSGFQYQLDSKIEDTCFVNTRLIVKPKLARRKGLKLSTSLEY